MLGCCSCDPRDRDEAGWRRLHAHCMRVIADAGECTILIACMPGCTYYATVNQHIVGHRNMNVLPLRSQVMPTLHLEAPLF